MLKYILVKQNLAMEASLCLLEEKMNWVFLKIRTKNRDFI